MDGCIASISGHSKPLFFEIEANGSEKALLEYRENYKGAWNRIPNSLLKVICIIANLDYNTNQNKCMYVFLYSMCMDTHMHVYTKK